MVAVAVPFCHPEFDLIALAIGVLAVLIIRGLVQTGKTAEFGGQLLCAGAVLRACRLRHSATNHPLTPAQAAVGASVDEGLLQGSGFPILVPPCTFA